MSADGISKTLAFKVESSFGVLPGDTGAQYLRRRTSGINLIADEIENDEIASHGQVATVGQGSRRVEGTIEALLSGLTYQKPYEALLRRDATAVSNITGLTLTTDDTDPVNPTLSRSAGNWVSDGLRVGMVIAVTAGLNAASLNRRLYVKSFTDADTLVYTPLDDDGPLLDESAVGSCTVVVPGKVNYIPTTGRTDKSFTFEEGHTDVGLYYVSTGCKFAAANHTFTPDQAAQVTFNVMGKDQAAPASGDYFTTPTAETTTEMLVPIFGKLLVDGVAYDGITQMTLSIDGGMQGTKAIGTATAPSISLGRIKVTCNIVPYLQDDQFDDLFINRGEVSIFLYLTENGDVNTQFQSFFMPKVKVSSATRDDGEKPLAQTVNGRALLKPTTSGFFSTSLQMQDSQYV